MINKLQKYLPVGLSAVKVKNTAVTGFILSVIISVFMYFNIFFSSLEALYYYDRQGRKILDISEMMPDHRVLRENCFDVFLIMLMCCLVFAVYNFVYHYIGSKSIYTMLRLKSRKEFIVRCISIPLVFAAVLILTVVILNFIYYFTYLFLVPAECMHFEWKEMWRF